MKILVSLLLFVSVATAQEVKINNISASALKKVLTSKNTQLIDVRTGMEFALGHIENAVNISYYSMNDNDIKKLDKQKPIYVYCRSGVRSMKASKVFKKLGFLKIYNISGGYLAWSKL